MQLVSKPSPFKIPTALATVAEEQPTRQRPFVMLIVSTFSFACLSGDDITRPQSALK